MLYYNGIYVQTYIPFQKLQSLKNEICKLKIQHKQATINNNNTKIYNAHIVKH